MTSNCCILSLARKYSIYTCLRRTSGGGGSRVEMKRQTKHPNSPPELTYSYRHFSSKPGDFPRPRSNPPSTSFDPPLRGFCKLMRGVAVRWWCLIPSAVCQIRTEYCKEEDIQFNSSASMQQKITWPPYHL
jgi:hypothetical protein